MLVYIPQCIDQSYYVGVTNDIERRISEHNLGFDVSSYTYNKRPVVVKFCEAFDDPMEAITLEKRLKGWSRKKKEALFRREWEEIKKLATSYSKRTSPTMSC